MTPASEPTSPPAAAPSSELLSTSFMHRLDQLDVRSRKVLAGKLQGERRSKRRGQSVEFADYRNYVAGDDLRFIDWNLYARLDRLFLRLFMEEEDLTVTILLDTSRSMDHGDPNKLRYAQQVAAALGYIGLSHYNRVTLMSFGAQIADQLPNLRGRRPIPQMLEFLRRQQVQEASDLAAVCRRVSLLQRTRGIVILISDLLDKGDLREALRFLGHERVDAYLMHVLSPQELDPSREKWAGDFRLIDAEDGDSTEVTLTPALLKRYQANLDAWTAEIRHEALRRGVMYLRTDTGRPFEELVLRYFRERGLLQ